MTSTASQGLLTRYDEAIMHTFATPPRVLERGQGAWVWDADGARYLDLLAGIAVNALGHAHPAIVAAVSDQLARLGHISNLFASRPQIELAERLLQLTAAPAGSRVFLCNSGTEANEAAFKMARRTGRPRILALEGSFHGRTMGALAITGNAAYRAPFEPLPGGVEFVAPGDEQALKAAMSDDVAAFVVEVIQGEAGVLPLSPGYLAAARRLTAEHGALLIIDEVQTGIGRTGAWLAHQLPAYQGEASWQPDVVTLAKGLGGGLPIGAVVAYGEAVASLLGPGDHGTTFGGNPVAAAAALATIETIAAAGLVERVPELERGVRDSVAALADARVTQVRGSGLLLGVGLAEPIAPAAGRAALDAGFIVNAPRPDTLRLAPPLIISDGELASFTAALPRILDAAQRQDEGVQAPAVATNPAELRAEGVSEP